MITERVPYGEGAIEPHRRKCLDHLTMPDPLPYYRQVVTALARLCATYRYDGGAPSAPRIHTSPTWLDGASSPSGRGCRS